MFGSWFKKKPERVYVQPDRKISDAAKSISIKADKNRVTPDVEKYIRTQIKNLNDIPKSERRFVADQFVIAIKEGGNSGRANWALGEVGVERRRAHEITRGISRHAKTKIQLASQIALGIEEGEWSYPGVLCFVRFPGDEEGERRGRMHEQANGKRFKLKSGLVINGEKTFPGFEWGCRCNWRPVLRGWNA